MASLADDLLRSRLFQDLPPEVAERLAADSTRRDLESGELLLRAGQENDLIYVVLSGSIEVRVAGVDQPYIRLGAGECVAELSVIDRLDVSADVIACEPTSVVAIHREALWAVIEDHAEVARNLLRILAGRVRYDDAAMLESAMVQHQLEQMAHIDGLTGLRNRRWLDEAFGRQLARTLHERQPVSLLMIDLDHFKKLNDRHGHLIGDAVLCHTARRLADNVRPQDLVARYGGEEFAVLLPNADGDQAAAVADRLRRAVAIPPVDADLADLPITTVSIGVATALDEMTMDGLLAAGDAALYRAKEAGRNRVSR